MVDVKDLTAETAAQAMLQVFAMLALGFVRTDNETQIINQMVISFLKLIGSEKINKVSYRSESNGMVEWANEDRWKICVLSHMIEVNKTIAGCLYLWCKE